MSQGGTSPLYHELPAEWSFPLLLLTELLKCSGHIVSVLCSHDEVVHGSHGPYLTPLLPAVQVRTNAAHNMCGHTFYVMDAGGAAPQRSTVEAACAQLGGQLMEPSPTQGPLSSSGTISFSFMGQQWRSSWGGSAGMPSHHTILPSCYRSFGAGIAVQDHVWTSTC